MIRCARPADAPAILDLWDIAAGPTRLVSDEQVIDDLLRRDPDALLVAEEGGAIVGTIIVGWDGWRCHLYRVAVAPGARRRGVGSELLAAAHLRAAQLGARRLDAMVSDDNPLGQAFWANAGFTSDDNDRRWIQTVRIS